MAIAVAYAGTMIGSLFLPARLPAVTDLLLPLMLGPDIFASWWLALAGFGATAGASVGRVYFMIRKAENESDIDDTMRYYR